MSIRIAEDRVVYDDDSTLEICATDIRASEINPRIGGRKRVIVHADTLRLDSPIVAPGAAITLIARKAYGGAQATVNVSGIDGVDAPQVPPPTPLDAAAPPQDGKDGGSGGACGAHRCALQGSGWAFGAHRGRWPGRLGPARCERSEREEGLSG